MQNFKTVKIKLLFLLIFFSSVKILAQSDYILGNVANQDGDKLPTTRIYNLRTDQVVLADKMGNFAILAKMSDELRIVKEGYERQTVVLTPESFSKSLDVKLTVIPLEIEEVAIGFNPTGNLKKDVPKLNPPAKVTALNMAMNNYMRTPMNEVAPTAKIPSAFAPKNPGEGQLSLFSIGSGGGGLVGALAGLAKKSVSSPKTTANYAEKQEFYKRVKAVVNLDYAKYGLDEYDFDIFLAFADEAHGLSKNYRKNFNRAAIESQLKVAFTEYLKTHNFSKKVTEG